MHAAGAPRPLRQTLARVIAAGRGIDDDRTVHGAAGPVSVERSGNRAIDHEAFHPVRGDSPPGHERAGGLARRESPDFIEAVEVEHLGQQAHAPAAALAEIGTQREPAERGGRGVARKHVARHANRLPLELAAADGPAEAAVRRDDHARTRLARRRAADFRDRHQRAAPVPTDHLGNHRPRPHPFNPPLASARLPVRMRTEVKRSTPAEMCPSFAMPCNANGALALAGGAPLRIDPRLPRLHRLRLGRTIDHGRTDERTNLPAPSVRSVRTAVARAAIGAGDSRTGGLRDRIRSGIKTRFIP